MRVGQSTRLPFEELINPFGGDLYSTRLETVEGNLVLRQEVTLFPSGVLSPRVRWERFHTLDGRFQNVRDLREEDVVTVRVQGTPTRDWTIGLEGALETERNIVERLVPTQAREEETFTTRAFR